MPEVTREAKATMVVTAVKKHGQNLERRVASRRSGTDCVGSAISSSRKRTMRWIARLMLMMIRSEAKFEEITVMGQPTAPKPRHESRGKGRIGEGRTTQRGDRKK